MTKLRSEDHIHTLQLQVQLANTTSHEWSNVQTPTVRKFIILIPFLIASQVELSLAIMSRRQRKRVLIVGAGAAGMPGAGTLAQHPVTGGQATSIPLEKAKYGVGWMNGACPSTNILSIIFSKSQRVGVITRGKTRLWAL